MSRRLLVLPVALAGLLLAAPSARATWVWPVRGPVITHYRNSDDPYAAGQHRGIDIAAPVGARVVAATSGEVRFAGTVGTSGLIVSIRTSDGRLDTSYLHLSSAAVGKGDHVSAGDRVGAVGTTGQRSAAAPHLHFGVRDAGTRHGYHDPLAYLQPPPAPAPRPDPAPASAPEPVTLAPRPEPLPRPSPRRRLPHSVRLPLPAPVPLRGPNPLVAPDPTPHLGRAPSSAPSPKRASTAGSRLDAPRPTPAAGPDLGWALACVALLLAAALLGLSEDGRAATRRSRSRIVGALQPLLGRRP